MHAVRVQSSVCVIKIMKTLYIGSRQLGSRKTDLTTCLFPCSHPTGKGRTLKEYVHRGGSGVRVTGKLLIIYGIQAPRASALTLADTREGNKSSLRPRTGAIL